MAVMRTATEFLSSLVLSIHSASLSFSCGKKKVTASEPKSNFVTLPGKFELTDINPNTFLMDTEMTEKLLSSKLTSRRIKKVGTNQKMLYLKITDPVLLIDFQALNADNELNT